MQSVSAVRAGDPAGSAASCSVCCSRFGDFCCFSCVSPRFAFIFAPQPPDIHSFKSDGEKSLVPPGGLQYNYFMEILETRRGIL